MAEKAVRKTTTKKPVRKAAPKKAAAGSVPVKKTTPKKVMRKTPARKAPTPVAATKADEKLHNYILIGGLVVFVCIIGGSVALGMSGSGEISIETRIADIKEQASPEERSKIDSIPVQKTPLRDGGLVPSGVPEKKAAPVAPVATSTDTVSTSTDEIATSTEAVVDDEEVLPDEPTADAVTDTQTEAVPVATE